MPALALKPEKKIPDTTNLLAPPNDFCGDTSTKVDGHVKECEAWLITAPKVFYAVYGTRLCFDRRTSSEAMSRISGRLLGLGSCLDLC